MERSHCSTADHAPSSLVGHHSVHLFIIYYGENHISESWDIIHIWTNYGLYGHHIMDSPTKRGFTNWDEASARSGTQSQPSPSYSTHAGSWTTLSRFFNGTCISSGSLVDVRYITKTQDTKTSAVHLPIRLSTLFKVNTVWTLLSYCRRIKHSNGYIIPFL